MPQLPVRPGQPCPHPECGTEVQEIQGEPWLNVTTLLDPYVKYWGVKYTALPCQHAWYVENPRPKSLRQTFPRAEQTQLRCLWPHDAHWGMAVTGTDEEYVHMMCFICRVEWQYKIKAYMDYDDSWD